METCYVPLEHARTELIKKWQRLKRDFNMRKARVSSPHGPPDPSHMPVLSPEIPSTEPPPEARGSCALNVSSGPGQGAADSHRGEHSLTRVTPPRTSAADPGGDHSTPVPGSAHQNANTGLPDLSLVAPDPLVKLTATSSLEDKRKAKEHIRTILTESTALRGIKPASIHTEEKREKLSAWDSSKQGEPKQKEERLAWPIHFRVKEVTSSFNKRLEKLTEHESKLLASEFSRIPATSLPDPDFPEYVLLSETLPGWTGKRPSSTAPLDKQVIPEKATAEVTVKGLRESADDWRQTLALASVISHSIDTLDELSKIPAADRTPQMFKDNLEVARAGLSKVILTSTKNIANSTLWERKRVQNSFMDANLARLQVKDLAACRTGPIDSEEHVFGSGRNLHTDLVKLRTEERLHTIQVQIDPKPQSNQPFRQGSGSSTKPAQSSSKAKSSSKPKSRPRSHKGKKQDKSHDKPKKVTSPKADKPESTAGKKPAYYKNKSKKKGASSKHTE